MGYTVALTGGIGSGKSTVANAFADLGTHVIDADIIARQVVEPGSTALQAIVARYGAEMLLADGSLNRRQLRERIFTHADEKAWLNALLHPLIQQETQPPDAAGNLSVCFMGCSLAGGKQALAKS